VSESYDVHSMHCYSVTSTYFPQFAVGKPVLHPPWPTTLDTLKAKHCVSIYYAVNKIELIKIT
jgi:hypothetical protein